MSWQPRQFRESSGEDQKTLERGMVAGDWSSKVGDMGKGEREVMADISLSLVAKQPLPI